MKITDISAYSNQLYKEMGAQAIAVAAQRARKSEQAGEHDEAETWRKVERTLLEKRGPHQG